MPSSCRFRECTYMNFIDVAWAAYIDHCIAGRNSKYINLFSNYYLVSSLRQAPASLNFEYFCQNVCSDFLNSWGKMYIQNNSINNDALNIYNAIIQLNPLVCQIQNQTILTCNLSQGSPLYLNIIQMYDTLTNIGGISMTGFSKIAHILNDRLFPLIDNPIRKELRAAYNVSHDSQGYINWMREMKNQANEVIDDFHQKGFKGSPEIFLSQHLGYDVKGHIKSIVKFLDEYYWLTITHGLTIPPSWSPCNLIFKIATL